jgi:hypothetical protein
MTAHERTHVTSPVTGPTKNALHAAALAALRCYRSLGESGLGRA